jgi:hypothetical protein
MLTILDPSREKILRVEIAPAFVQRLLGLLGRAAQQDQALWLKPCNWVHSLGMRQALLLFYLDSEQTILRKHRLAPGRLGPRVGRAVSVLEVWLPSWTEQVFHEGDQLTFSTRPLTEEV